MIISFVDINFITVQMVILFIQVSFMNNVNFSIITFVHLQDVYFDFD